MTLIALCCTRQSRAPQMEQQLFLLKIETVSFILRMPYTVRHEKWTILFPVLCLCNIKQKIQLHYVLTLRLLYTAENHCPAMSQRVTVKLRVLHAGLVYNTSLIYNIEMNVQVKVKVTVYISCPGIV